MYEVDDNGWVPFVSSYSYWCIQPEGLIYDADSDLLAIVFVDVFIHTVCLFHVIWSFVLPKW